jgi:hypothetical protein
MWTGFTDTTIGEWGEIILAFALLPAHLMSYLLPLYFFWHGAMRYVAKHPVVFDGRERHRKNFWGAYLLFSGFVLVALFGKDSFMFLQGIWEIACGVTIFLLGPSWWARGQKSVA